MIKYVIVTIHGQESVGANMEELTRLLGKEVFLEECKFINIRYTKLWTIVNALPWARSMTAKYVASRLNTISNYEFPEAVIIIVSHSNGTRATRIAMDMRLKPKKKWPPFHIDHLILLGCPIKRNYDWSKHPLTKVYNFVSSNDNIVWLARFYGMGSAGRFGFKKSVENLRQYHVKWGHNGFMKHYSVISNCIRLIVKTPPTD